jgi:hypothetical protein
MPLTEIVLGSRINRLKNSNINSMISQAGG